MFAINQNNKNKGQVLVLVALSLVVFIGFAALAIDVAYFYHTKHQLQGAADAGALAGAALLKCESYNGSNALQTTARNAAHEYAFNNIAASQSVDTKLNTGNDPNGDIIIGHWDGTNFTPEPGTDLQIGALINAVKVAPRRTSEPATDIKAGGNPVSTFFGKIFNIQTVNISTKAVAQGCVKLAPISVNEYWLGDEKITTNTDPTSCQNPRNPDNADGRVPYGIHHLYPNSFVRPPCPDSNHLFANITSGNRCTSPSNGNVERLPTLSCDPPGPTPAVTVAVIENGPLISSCTTDECKKGRVIVNPDTGNVTPSLTAGRVFAIVGSDAFSSSNDGGSMLSLIDLDSRSPCSKDNSEGGCEEWYSPPNFNSDQGKADSQMNKDVVAGYIKSGVYPYDLQINVNEVYQTGYVTTDPYPPTTPPKLASTSYFRGNGVVGPLVKANFYDNNYAGGKYAPGKTIIVTVYDGIVSAGGANQARVTIVGFARITIFGYGRDLQLDSLGIPSINDKFTPTSMYGYVATPLDFKPTYTELVTPEEGRSRLVQ